MTIAPPISKHWREEFVWVAQRKVGSTYKLTYNKEDMEPIGKLALREDNTCDICGACCEETLYLYRCYARTRLGEKCVGHNRGLNLSLAYIVVLLNNSRLML